MKKVFFSALLMGLAAVSFANNGNSKTSGSTLYWYEVDYSNPMYTNGYIPAGATLVAHAEQSQVPPKCDEGTDRDCLRGFDSPQTSATDDPGTEQIKTDEQP